MEKQKIGFEVLLLFLVSLLGGMVSTIIYGLGFSIKILSIFAVIIFVAIITITLLWDFHYVRHKREKSISDKKETRNNTREILKKLNQEK